MPRALTAAQLASTLALLATDRPFTTRQAREAGVPRARLRRLVEQRLLVRVLPGVYHLPGVVDSIEHRLLCLALVVPPDCVVTDRTAAWVWCGDRALAPDEHLATPRVSVFAPPGRRLRNGLAASGERHLEPHDVVEVGGVRVTTPLRTACDLGRLLHVDQAFAAMDTLAALEVFSVAQLLLELDRFKGYRGIVQARTWAPYVDAGSESQFESIARRRWLTAGLPRPQCQVPVPAPDGGWFRIDFGLPEERFGGEYFGAAFHGDDQSDHDESRLAWLREAQTWIIVVARTHNVTGPRQDYEQLLQLEWERHRGR